jgi:hypothetical protein
VESEHNVGREVVDVFDYLTGCPEIKGEAAFRFITDAVFMAVPPSSGICKIGSFVKVNVEIGFTNDIQAPVVIFFPDFFVVIF